MESLQEISQKRAREDDEIGQSCNNKLRAEDSEGLELLLGLSIAAQLHCSSSPSSPKKPRLEESSGHDESTDPELSEDEGSVLLGLQGSSNSDSEEWRENYNKLKEFHLEHGHIEVSSRDDRSLTAWIRHQRKETTRRKLSEEQTEKLSELGFIWSRRGAKNSWEEKFLKLKQFKERTGHCKVPLKLDRQLNSWVDAQRQANKQGRLSDERIRKLESLGVQWIVKSWESKFQKLVDFKESHGHCNVPLHSEKQLYRWVVDQRRAHKRGKLSADRVRRLEEIGIRLTSKKDMKYKGLEVVQSTD
jgi:hypothetical protein